MWLAGMPYFSVRYCTFSLLPTVAKTYSQTPVSKRTMHMRECTGTPFRGLTYLCTDHLAYLNGRVANSSSG